MGFETYQNLAKQKLDSLRDADLNSPVLDQVESFATSFDAPDPNKINPNYGDLQIWWQGEIDRSDETERLCLTFAAQSLTISLEHRHLSNQFPLFPQETNADRYTLLIKRTVTPQEIDALRSSDTHPTFGPEGEYIPPTTLSSLHRSHSLRAGSQPTVYGESAETLFQPRFEHALRVLGFTAAEHSELSEFQNTSIEIAS